TSMPLRPSKVEPALVPVHNCPTLPAPAAVCVFPSISVHDVRTTYADVVIAFRADAASEIDPGAAYVRNTLAFESFHICDGFRVASKRPLVTCVGVSVTV